MAGIRVYINFYGLPLHNSIGFNILMLVCFCVLLPVCVVIALVSVIYYIVYILYIRPKQMEEDEEFKADREKGKIFLMIELMNVNTKMQLIRDEDNVFKKITKSKLTIVEYSNQLFKETLESQK